MKIAYMVIVERPPDEDLAAIDGQMHDTIELGFVKDFSIKRQWILPSAEEVKSAQEENLRGSP